MYSLGQVCGNYIWWGLGLGTRRFGFGHLLAMEYFVTKRSRPVHHM